MSRKKRTCIIKHKTKTNFTVIPNAVCRDLRLSWKAIGLLVFLLHLPEDFEVRLKNLSNIREGNGNRRESIRGAISELVLCGYVTVERERKRNGQWGGTFWHITNVPDTLPAVSNAWNEDKDEEF